MPVCERELNGQQGTNVDNNVTCCFSRLGAPGEIRTPDPLALSVYDEEHSDEEERWVTPGHAENGQLMVVIHTYQEISPSNAVIRIISARQATKLEKRQYESEN